MKKAILTSLLLVISSIFGMESSDLPTATNQPIAVNLGNLPLEDIDEIMTHLSEKERQYLLIALGKEYYNLYGKGVAAGKEFAKLIKKLPSGTVSDNLENIKKFLSKTELIQDSPDTLLLSDFLFSLYFYLQNADSMENSEKVLLLQHINKILQALISKGARVHKKNQESPLLLYIGMLSFIKIPEDALPEVKKTIEELISAGANIDAKKIGAESTPLMQAVENRDERIVKILLELGANPNAQALDGETALQNAVQRNNKDIVALLLDHNADPSLKITADKTAIDFAQSDEIRELLEKAAKK